MQPDYYLALPWHFIDEFLDREREFLDRGGKFIVPMPAVRVVSESPLPDLSPQNVPVVAKRGH
jgi:hypothetical protein